MLTRRRRHRGETGQVMVMALGFIAFFGVLTVAVLNYADTTLLQKAGIERSTLRDSLAQGGAAWAAADAAAAGSVCAAGNHGALTMVGGDTVTYMTNPNGCRSGGAAGANCRVCLLGGSPLSPGAILLNTNGGVQLTVDGEIYVNGSIAGGPVASVGFTQGIWLYGGTCATCTPAAQYLTAPFADPLAGWLAANRPGVPGPVQPELTLTDTVATLHPGVYSTITATHSAVTLSPGVYVFTAPVTFSDSVVTGADVVLYLACPTTPPHWSCAAPGDAGGSLKATGVTTATVVAPLTGPYAGVSLFADANLTDPDPHPADWSTCAGTVSCPLLFGGAGPVTLSGLVYLPAGSIDLAATARVSVGGRIIARALSGADDLNLVLTGPSPLPCPAVDDSVSGSSPSRSSSGTARAIVQAGCAGHYGIVDFNYHP